MTALPRSTTNIRRRLSTSNLLALAFAALLVSFPTIAHAMPASGGPAPPPLPGDDAGGDDLFLLNAAVRNNFV